MAADAVLDDQQAQQARPVRHARFTAGGAAPPIAAPPVATLSTARLAGLDGADPLLALVSADQALAGRLRRAVARQPHRGPDALGLVEAAAVLWRRFLRFDPDDPQWPDRDRLVVGNARFAPILRALLTLDEDASGQDDSLFGFGQHPAVEMAVGPAGQGIATGVGLALAERLLASRFGQSLIDHRTWVLACESELSAGVALEAAAMAGQMRLERLTVLFELEEPAGTVAAGGDTALPLSRFAACGWSVRRVGADDIEGLALALAGAARGRKPSLIACVVQRRAADPAKPPTAPATTLPPGSRGQTARRAWLKRLARHRMRDEFERVLAGRLPSGWLEGWRAAWREGSETPPYDGFAGRGLASLSELLPEFISLTCEARRLPPAPLEPPVPGRPPRAVDLGTQEHGMAAMANGLALHGGLLVCGAASFIAIDRMRPALRLGALMRRQVIHLLTHDGLALGEDGAAWQPVEQLASLRAMPNVAVFRPADDVEMMECWQLALRRRDGPSLIAVSPRLPREARPTRRAQGSPGAPAATACARGGYLLAEPPHGLARDVSLIATGPEVGIALAARRLLKTHGLGAAVVSLPCWELFTLQAAAYREAVLGGTLRVGIEAASGFGWERWIGPDGLFIGIEEFGVSAPADELYRQFGLTPEAVVDRIRRRLAIALWPRARVRP